MNENFDITFFHTAVFQDVKGTGVNGTIEKGLDLVAYLYVVFSLP